MAVSRNDQAFVPSILDRLILPARGARVRGRQQSLRELKESLRRDLEALLNTRYRATHWPPKLDDELAVSLANYGLPDFTGAQLSATETQQQFREVLERTIAAFEPRLERVKVSLVRSGEEGGRTLHFRIDARLEASAEPVVFDSKLKPLSTHFEVSGGDV